jgi:hypothetical protein
MAKCPKIIIVYEILLCNSLKSKADKIGKSDKKITRHLKRYFILFNIFYKLYSIIVWHEYC